MVQTALNILERGGSDPQTVAFRLVETINSCYDAELSRSHQGFKHEIFQESPVPLKKSKPSKSSNSRSAKSNRRRNQGNRGSITKIRGPSQHGEQRPLVQRPLQPAPILAAPILAAPHGHITSFTGSGHLQQQQESLANSMPSGTERSHHQAWHLRAMQLEQATSRYGHQLQSTTAPVEHWAENSSVGHQFPENMQQSRPFIQSDYSASTYDSRRQLHSLGIPGTNAPMTFQQGHAMIGSSCPRRSPGYAGFTTWNTSDMTGHGSDQGTK